MCGVQSVRRADAQRDGKDASVDSTVDSAGEADSDEEGSVDDASDVNMGDVAADANTGGARDGSASDANNEAGDVAAPRCPVGQGAEMVLIDAAGTQYCIDRYEVTIDDYRDYLQAAGTFGKPVMPASAHPRCKWGDADTPTKSDLTVASKHPVVSVSWCYAYAYCVWAGKRLCGRIGAGNESGAGPDRLDAKNEWNYACGSGAGLTYPYGDSYQATACATDDADAGPRDVGSSTNCHGDAAPFGRLYDMSGNVAEWDNWSSLVDPDAGVYQVHGRGGAWVSGKDDANCTAAMGTGITAGSPQIGIRCCADPL